VKTFTTGQWDKIMAALQPLERNMKSYILDELMELPLESQDILDHAKVYGVSFIVKAIQRYAKTRTTRRIEAFIRIEMQATLDIVRWASCQRRLYHAGKLPQEQIDRLESMPTWTWDEATWRKKVSA